MTPVPEQRRSRRDEGRVKKLGPLKAEQAEPRVQPLALGRPGAPL